MNETTLYLIIFGLLAIPLAYLIGSFSNSIFISRLLYKKDIREYGSKNAGGTNAGRVFGRGFGITIIILDMLKAIFVYYALYLTMMWSGLSNEVAAHIISGVALLALSIGHCYPLFYGFRGGKGVAIFAGLIVASNWLLTLLGIIIFFLIVSQKKIVSIASMGSAAILALLSFLYFIPAMQSIVAGLYVVPNISVYTSLLTILTLFLIFQHRDNIKRLKAGTENVIGQKKQGGSN